MKRYLSIAVGIAFAGTVFLANWALERYGFVSIGFGLAAPAGVYFAGLAFGLRDALHELAGRTWVLAAICAGAVCAWFIEPTFAYASATAFLVSELADLAVYEPLRRRQWTVAVVASNIVGAVVDSLLFLHLAFGTTDGWIDLTVGKAYMVLPAIVLVGYVRRAVLR